MSIKNCGCAQTFNGNPNAENRHEPWDFDGFWGGLFSDTPKRLWHGSKDWYPGRIISVPLGIAPQKATTETTSCVIASPHQNFFKGGSISS